MEAPRTCGSFVSTPGFYQLCLTCKMFGGRPSAALGIEDSYTAYCLDEAGAFLMAQKEPPRYGQGGKKGKKKPINRDREAMRALAALGAQVDI